MAADLHQVHVMLQQLNEEESSKVGLTMDWSRTKVMTNIGDDKDIKIDDTAIERVNSYV